jgi:hypothetical protein
MPTAPQRRSQASIEGLALKTGIRGRGGGSLVRTTSGSPELTSLPRVAGKSASRLTCPSRNQSRARARSDTGSKATGPRCRITPIAVAAPVRPLCLTTGSAAVLKAGQQSPATGCSSACEDPTVRAGAVPRRPEGKRRAVTVRGLGDGLQVCAPHKSGSCRGPERCCPTRLLELSPITTSTSSDAGAPD